MMSGLRFESMADMPPRMRELYARQQVDLSGAAAPAPLHKGSLSRPPLDKSGASAIISIEKALRQAVSLG